MAITKWEPWKHTSTVVCEIAIAGPPCPDCHFWWPITQVAYLPTGPIADGVRCCQAPEMQHDFSCFRPRKTEAD